MKNIMTELRNDQELVELKKRWNKDIMGRGFPLYNWDEYMGLEDYKDVIKWWLDHPEWKPEVDKYGCMIRPHELIEYTRKARAARQ